MGADKPGWVAPRARAARARPAALTLMGRARARKQDTDLSDRLAGQGFRVPGRDAVLTIIGLQDAGALPECGAPARVQVTGLAGAGDAGIGSGILIGDHKYDCGDRGVVQAAGVPRAG